MRALSHHRSLFSTQAKFRRKLFAATPTFHVESLESRRLLSAASFVQQAELAATDGLPGDQFGYSVAISGNTAVVGATEYDASNTQDSRPGAVYVFTLSGSTWVESAELTASDGSPNDYFGDSVAISGNMVAVGAQYATVGGNSRQGQVYVFTEPSGGWSGNITQTAKLTVADGKAGDEFGSSVAINGNTVVAGALDAKVGNNSQQGTAYAFTLTGNSTGNITGIVTGNVSGNAATGNSTALIAQLTASDGNASDWFGNSISISGTTVVVGAEHASVVNNGVDNTWQGAAYVFTEPGTGWTGNVTQTAKLTATDGNASDQFGDSVSINGNTTVIGAYRATVNGNPSQGAAYVFTEPAAGWAGNATQVKLTASDGAVEDEFGGSVAIDGNTLAIGADQANTGQGVTYTFVEQPGTDWGNVTQSDELTSSDGVAGDRFGSAVAISGTTVIIGADQASYDSGTSTAGDGAAYVFTNPTIVVTSPGTEIANAGGNQPFTLGSFTDSDGCATTPYTVEVNWGDGTANTIIGNLTATGTIPAQKHIYASTGNDTVTVTVTDAANNTSNNNLTFTVDVAAIAVTSPGNQSAMMGQNQSFNLGNFSQTNATGPFSVDVNWGDGTTDTVINGLTANLTGATALPMESHTYSSVGNDTVTISVTDVDNHTSNLDSFTVDVASIAVTSPANQGANAGLSQSFALGSFTESNATGPYTVTINWGDGSGNTTIGNLSTAGTIPATAHTYVTTGNDTVSITVTDSDNHTSNNAEFTVDVGAIALTAPGNQTATTGLSKLFILGNFTALSATSPFSVDVNWGDGSPDSSITMGSAGTITPVAHTYASSGTDTISLTVTGSGNQVSNVATFTVTVTQALPAFSNLSDSSSIGQGTPAVAFSGTITVGNLTPPSTEVVAITLNGVTQDANIDSNGNFGSLFNTSQLTASNTPYQVTYSYAGDVSFSAVTDNTTTALTVNGVEEPVYRLFSPVTKEHLYTVDLNENNTLATRGWIQEGVAFNWYSGPITLDGVTAEPIYRLYNIPQQQHLWTTDPNEYTTLEAFVGTWSAEGIVGYVFPTAVASSTALYRLSYPFLTDIHLWTIDQNEVNTLVSQDGWVEEGIIGYVL